MSILQHCRSFGDCIKESLHYFTHPKSWYPVPEGSIRFQDIPRLKPLPVKQMSKDNIQRLIDFSMYTEERSDNELDVRRPQWLKLGSFRPVGSGGQGGLQPPNNLLKFAEFVSEKGCKRQGSKKEDSNLYIFEEATRIYQKYNIFVILVKKFKIFMGRLSLVVILCFRQ